MGSADINGDGKADVIGRTDGGGWWAGLAQGLIHDVPTVADLVERVVTGAEQIIRGRLSAVLAEPMEV